MNFSKDPDNNSWNHHFGKGKNELSIHYVRHGEGKPVLLLHGWPGFWYDWRKVIPELSRYGDVIAPDLRGFGDSEKPAGDPVETYSPEVHVADLKVLLDDLGIEKVVVAAHDIGATIAQTFVRLHPEKVESLVLFNPPYPGIGGRRFDPEVQGEFWYQQFHYLTVAEKLVGKDRDSVAIYLEYFYHHWTGKKSQLSTKELNYIYDKYAVPGAFEASIAYYRARAGAKTKKAQTVNMPDKIPHRTSILWGEKDPVMLSAWSDRISDYFSEASVELLAGVGHFVPFEQPDRVVETIKEHLS